MEKKENKKLFLLDKPMDLTQKPPVHKALEGVIWEEPIYYKNKIFGDLIFLTNIKNIAQKEETLHEFMAMSNHLRFFMEVIENEIKIYNEYKKEIDRSTLLVKIVRFGDYDKFRFFSERSPQTFLGYYIYAQEDALFNLIKSEGPIILCNPDVQERILNWLTDRENASSRMNRLKDSLLEYSYGAQVLSTRFKSGRPQINILKKLGKKGIRESYKFLTMTLKEIKPHLIRSSLIDMREKIIKDLKEFSKELKSILKSRRKKSNKKNLVIFRLVEECVFLLNLFDVITSDRELESEFIRYKWQPNKFAKKILMKLLDISDSKLNKALYQ